MDIEIILLAAGAGSRIADYTKGKPKQFIEVGDKLVIDYLLELISQTKHNIKGVHVVVSDKTRPIYQHVVRYYANKGAPFALREIKQTIQPLPLGVAHAVHCVYQKHTLHTPNAVVLYTDTITTMPIDSVINPDYDAMITLSPRTKDGDALVDIDGERVVHIDEPHFDDHFEQHPSQFQPGNIVFLRDGQYMSGHVADQLEYEDMISPKHELRITAYLNYLIEFERAKVGFVIDPTMVDCGTLQGLQDAFAIYGTHAQSQALMDYAIEYEKTQINKIVELIKSH